MTSPSGVNDMPGPSFVGTIYEFRVRGKSVIEGWPDYDYTFRSPERAEAARNAWDIINSPSFMGALKEIRIDHRRVQFRDWELSWVGTTDFTTYVNEVLASTSEGAPTNEPS